MIRCTTHNHTIKMDLHSWSTNEGKKIDNWQCQFYLILEWNNNDNGELITNIFGILEVNKNISDISPYDCGVVVETKGHHVNGSNSNFDRYIALDYKITMCVAMTKYSSYNHHAPQWVHPWPTSHSSWSFKLVPLG